MGEVVAVVVSIALQFPVFRGTSKLNCHSDFELPFLLSLLEGGGGGGCGGGGGGTCRIVRNKPCDCQRSSTFLLSVYLLGCGGC